MSSEEAAARPAIEMEEGEDDGEKSTLMAAAGKQDGEVYSLRACFKARSCLLGVAVSVAVVIALVLLVVALAVGLHVTTNKTCEHPLFTLDDVFDSNFTFSSYGGTWNGGRLLQWGAQEGVTLFDPRDNSTATIINPAAFEAFAEMYGKVATVSPSPVSDDIILLGTNQEQVYKYSRLRDYFIYSGGDVMNVTKPQELLDRKFQYIKFSPNGQYLAYVLSYNIYVLDVSDLGSSSPIPITADGSQNGIWYGIPDWVYEEEVLSADFALWWSGDSQRLLFASFNDTLVGIFEFPIYGPPEDQYTDIEAISYPKPGTTNPTVTLNVVAVADPSNVTTLNPPDDNDLGFDHYFSHAGWSSSSSSSPFLTWLNRAQNVSILCTYQQDSQDCSHVYTERVTSGWVEQGADPVFIAGGKVVMLLANGGGYTHIAEIDLTAGSQQEPQFLTEGSWDVAGIISANQDIILYYSTESDPGQRHVYSYSVSAANSICLTCDQAGWEIPKSPNPSFPDTCSYFTASCDRNATFCVLKCSGPCVPYSILVSFADQEFKLVSVLETNDKFRQAVKSKELPTVDHFVIPSDEDGPSLYGMMKLPPHFNSKHQYPVFVYVYGGPNSQTVDYTNFMSSLSQVFYAANLSIIVASVDGRGTGFRGNGFKFPVYRELGKFETIDQIRAGRYFQSLSYVDGSRLALQGSSYGGYMAARVGSSGSGVFHATISQAPVTDWLYYDSIYTERYMGLPTSEDNAAGYGLTSVLPHARNLSEVDFLLIHGTGDDNVHFQHTTQLVEALTQADVQFHLQIYTDKAHSLTGGNTRRHLYELTANFLRESFQLDPA